MRVFGDSKNANRIGSATEGGETSITVNLGPQTGPHAHASWPGSEFLISRWSSVDVDELQRWSGKDGRFIFCLWTGCAC